MAGTTNAVKHFKREASRGDPFEVHGRPALVAYHPSAVLRADERATEIRHALVADVQLACAWAVR